MSSNFSPRASAVPGSGGKMVRDRRLRPPASPYLRPEPKSPTPSASPSWIFSAARSVAAGAGKFLSVFSSVSPSTSDDSSGYTSSDGSGDGDDNDDEERDDESGYGVRCICSKEVVELNQNEVVASKGSRKDLHPIAQAQKSETKLAIEQLLLQETFTREECIKLTKIIQSRVVDCPTAKEAKDGTQKAPLDQSIATVIASPRASAVHAYTPDHCNTPIMEARKWLKEKKLETSSKSGLDHGPCTLNTAMLLDDDEGDVGSPVDMAKSYMQSRPLWASPSLLSFGFRTPPPVGVGPPLYEDATQYDIDSYSLRPSKLLKRDSLHIGSCNTLDEIRKIRRKCIEETSELLLLKPTDSTARTVEKETTKSWSATKKRIEPVALTHDSDSVWAVRSVDASDLPMGLAANDNFEEGVHVVQKAVEANVSVSTVPNKKTSNCIFSKNVTGSGEAMIEENLGHEVSSLRNEVLASSPTISDSNKSQDLENVRLTEEKLGGSSLSHGSLVPDSVSLEQNGRFSLVMNTEQKVMPTEETDSSFPSTAYRPTNHNDARVSSSGLQTCSQAEKAALVEDSCEPQVLHLQETFLMPDSSLPSTDQMQKENGMSNNAESNDSTASPSGLVAGLNMNADPIVFDKNSQKNSTSLSHEVLAVANSEETCEPLSEASMEVPLNLEDNDMKVTSQNGKTKTSTRRRSRASGSRGKKAEFNRRGRGSTGRGK